MTKQVGVSPATVQRIWSGRGLKPRLNQAFKLCNDPAFEKLIDVVGLCLNPPEKAVVLLDDKTSIQALGHTGFVADDQGPGGHNHQRLPAARHHDTVRCLQSP